MEKSKILVVGGAGYVGSHMVKDLIERDVTGKPIPAMEAERRPGDPATLIAGSDKIKQSLGWKPRYEELKTIIETAWRWHQKDATARFTQ